MQYCSPLEHSHHGGSWHQRPAHSAAEPKRRRPPRDLSRQWNLSDSLWSAVDASWTLSSFMTTIQSSRVFSLRSELERCWTVEVLAKPCGHVAFCQDSLSTRFFFFSSLAVSQRPGLFAQRVSPFLSPQETTETDAVF